MRVVGVLDLLNGRAVHGRAGRRDEYGPVRSVAGVSIEPGDPLALARIYLDRFRLTELYAADLDAIRGTAAQEAVVAQVASLGAALWLDAGITSVARARRAVGLGAAQVVIGLETLSSYEALADIAAAVGAERVAFSLDLRDGEPLVGAGRIGGQDRSHAIAPGPPEAIAARAVEAGAASVIVIDLARVGTGTGLDLAMVRRVRAAAPHVTLFAGGGVRGADDLARLADVGCDGALVASALHNGRLSADEVATVSSNQRGTAAQS
jgi:phosphoribosylformimino-5-aminoimidazole carboxamide ribotide isomerase